MAGLRKPKKDTKGFSRNFYWKIYLYLKPRSAYLKIIKRSLFVGLLLKHVITTVMALKLKGKRCSKNILTLFQLKEILSGKGMIDQNKLITILSYNLLVIILFYNSACTLTFQFLNKFLLVSSNIMCHLCGVETICHGLILVYSKKFVVIPIIIKTWEYSTLPFQNKIINSLHPK